MPRPKTTRHQSDMPEVSELEQNVEVRQKRRLEEVALEEQVWLHVLIIPTTVSYSFHSQDERVPVQVYPVHIFLLRDGTSPRPSCSADTNGHCSLVDLTGTVISIHSIYY
jgi:hypothetical protein